MTVCGEKMSGVCVMGKCPYVKQCNTAVWDKTPQEHITNEEWLHTLNTEEMVDYLYSVHKGGASVERQFWIEEHKERIKMQFRGWLKAKHDKSDTE